MSDMREFINLVEGKQTTSKKVIKESFEVQGRVYDTIEFDSKEETNKFLEENEFYGFIGEKDGKFHVAKNEDTGTPVEEEKDGGSHLEEITDAIGSEEKAQSIMKWVEENDFEITDVNDISQSNFSANESFTGVELTFSNGEEYKFMADQDSANSAAYVSIDSLVDDIGIMQTFGPGFIDHYINWNRLGEEYADDEYNHGYESAESWIEEEPAEDGEYSEEQKDRAGNLAKERVLDDPEDFVRGIYGDEIPNEVIDNYIDSEQAIFDSISQDGTGHTLAGYDGQEHELDNDVLAYRWN